MLHDPLDDSIQSAYRRVVEGSPAIAPEPADSHEARTSTCARGTSNDMTLVQSSDRPERTSEREGVVDVGPGGADHRSRSAAPAAAVGAAERLTLDAVVDRASTRRESHLDSAGPESTTHHGRSQHGLADTHASELRDAEPEARVDESRDAKSAADPADPAEKLEVALIRAEARLAWSRVRVLEEALADACGEHERLREELERMRAERHDPTPAPGASGRPAIPPIALHAPELPSNPRLPADEPTEDRQTDAPVNATDGDALRLELARQQRAHARVVEENAHLRETLRRAELALEDAQVIRRGLRDDLRTWRRRALEAEAHVCTTHEGPEADAWREAAALARRVVEAEVRAAELADDAEATRRERDQLEAVVAALSEAIDAGDDDAWVRASMVGERITEELAASERVNERLVRERDSAFDALTRSQARYEARVEAMRQLRRRRASRRRNLNRRRNRT